GAPGNAEVKPGSGDDADHRRVIVKLFSDLAPRFAERPGGYTRIIKRHERRLGDAGPTAFLELLKEGEQKVRARAPAPAGRGEAEEEAPAAAEGAGEGEAPAEQTPESPPQGAAPEAGQPEEGQQTPPPGTAPENPPRP